MSVKDLFIYLTTLSPSPLLFLSLSLSLYLSIYLSQSVFYIRRYFFTIYLSIYLSIRVCSYIYQFNNVCLLYIYLIIIMSRLQHGYPWPSLATHPYCPLLPAGLQGTSRISTELLYVGSSWPSYLCSSMWRSPQEYVTYELVSTSPVGSRMSGSSQEKYAGVINNFTRRI